MNAWYATLNRPPLTPPNWIFAPVWSVLYLMIAIAILLYYRSSGKYHPWLTSLILALHLSANFVWTYLFFRLQSPAAALADILFLDLSLLVLIAAFWVSSKAAAFLLMPYLLWVLFATYLNYAFYKLN